MTPVQVNWLTLLLAPIAVVGLVVALGAKLSSSRRGEPMPGWANAVQGAAIAVVLLVAILNW
ncbi:hypothetical protein EJ357_23790 [Streptomyces cyaneochromogenes]|uniref:Uncharacterized protein n=1 Tax=Streptomyces cyaneochromogenes TaxID=2496836 RepID=A0A3S9MAE5_9ACTN|nr:hypothetical protein [Streptomyces cyaneochromogenes]AZQ36131.1 hypothetical protein EJ357_23790 [Streptomyces cyaneochromogenes]